MRDDIQDHVRELEAKLANQKARLTQYAKMVDAGIAAVDKAQRAANLTATPGPGDVRETPEPQKRTATLDPAVLKDLKQRLEAGAHGFVENPEEKYEQYKADWEKRQPEQEKLLNPLEWAMRQVTAYVVDIMPQELRSAKHRRTDTDAAAGGAGVAK